MKTFLCSFVVLFAVFICINSNALDFTGTDGTVYKDASVLKVMPDGLVISYVDANGFEDIKHINISQLPDAIKKEYHLSAQTAASFDSQRLATINSINAEKAKDTKEYYAEQKKEVEDFTRVRDYLRANEVAITFSSINQVDSGSIGYAYRSDDYDKESPFGLICLLGNSVEPDQEWVGKVYPLNKSMKYQNPVSTQASGNMVQGGQVTGNTQATQKEKIPCYADYATALDYFSNNPQAISSASVPSKNLPVLSNGNEQYIQQPTNDSDLKSLGK